MEKQTFTKENLLKEIMRTKNGIFRALTALGISSLLLYKLLNLTQLINGSAQYVTTIVILAIIFWAALFSTCYYVFYAITYKMISRQQFNDFKKEKINTISQKIEELTKIEKETEVLLKEKYINDLDSHTILFLCKQNGVLDPQKISTFILLLQEKIIMYKKRLSKISTSLPVSKIAQSLLINENITPQDYKNAIEVEFLQQTIRAIEGCISSFQEETLTGDKIDAVYFGNRVQSNIRHLYSSASFYQYFFKDKKDFLETQKLLLLSIVFE